LFFRKMSETEIVNGRKGQVLGFITFAILLLINIIYHRVSEIELFSSLTILLAGLVVAFGYEFFLNAMDKSRRKR
jgi:chromate transport protein ChrA